MDKKIIAVLVVVVAIAAVLFFNPFKPAPEPTDENTYIVDKNVGEGATDLYTPEELLAHDTQLQQSDPVRYNALQQKDPAICNTEPKPEDIDWCKAAVAEVKKDESICTGLQGAARNQCYNDVARATQNLELCRNVTSVDWSDECIQGIATKQQNLNACFEIKNSAMGDDCIAIIAAAKADTQICKRIRETAFIDECIGGIASDTMNPDTCLLISDIGMGDACIYEIADDAMDATICKKMRDALFRQDCEERVITLPEE